MPQLIMRGVDLAEVMKISTALVEELAQICRCGKDNFTLDVLNATSVSEGAIVPTFPFVEVAWFDRGREVQDAVATAITNHLLTTGIPEVEVAFKVYRETHYYANGQPFMVKAGPPVFD
ncbi:DUF1904 family protein [Paenibacillus sp. MWE-103]|uniref:DUF1904 family protein n=1 Tax=Paenibacillus artemisiicola TaxID=1172618 RepID=A0ABS3WHD0_9BACL|nr:MULTISPECIES: DUF1904 family protein [Paenibacillus]MBO7747697.1 DUF1904 family protein [Paenibacillus artemisiicola]SFJ51717.1 protein of unknown function [Paenibacillus sp. UNC496MF]